MSDEDKKTFGTDDALASIDDDDSRVIDDNDDDDLVVNDDDDDNEPQDNDKEPEGDDSGSGCDTCQHGLRDFIKEQFGEDLSHYADDYELIKALVNAKKMVGQRSDEASALRKLRERYGSEFVDQLLNGTVQLPRDDPKRKTEDDGEVEFRDEWLMMVTRDENGNLVPVPGADKDIPEKILKFAKYREKLLNDFARNPKRFIQGLIADEVAKITAKVVSDGIGQASKAVALQDFATQHKELLFQGGDPEAGMTEFGEELTALADQLIENGINDEYKALQFAFEALKGRIPQANKTKQPAASAYHAPRKTSKKEQVTVVDLIKKGYGLAEAIEMVANGE